MLVAQLLTDSSAFVTCKHAQHYQHYIEVIQQAKITAMVLPV